MLPLQEDHRGLTAKHELYDLRVVVCVLFLRLYSLPRATELVHLGMGLHYYWLANASKQQVGAARTPDGPRGGNRLWSTFEIEFHRQLVVRKEKG
jgi:hypothetical protein